VRPYEVMIIFDPSIDDGDVQSRLERTTEIIRSRGGSPGKVDHWGKRRLAYELRHQREGYYVVLDATAEPAMMDEVHRSLQLADEVLRHKVIRLPEKVAARKAPADTLAAPAAADTNVTSNGE
jgi:small subunit ribosomal protein S6